VSVHQHHLSCLHVYQAVAITVERLTIGPTPAHSLEIRAGVDVEVVDGGGETARAEVRQRAAPRLRPAIAPSQVTPTAEAAVQVGVLNSIPPPSGQNDLSQSTGCQLSVAWLISSPSAQAKVTSLMTNPVSFQSSAARLMTNEIDEGQGRSLN
jgi:hypothetical protein